MECWASTFYGLFQWWEKAGVVSCFHCRVMREDTFSLVFCRASWICIVNFNVPLKWWGMLNLRERGRGWKLDSTWNLSWMDCDMENTNVSWMSKIHFPSELLSFWFISSSRVLSYPLCSLIVKPLKRRNANTTVLLDIKVTLTLKCIPNWTWHL